MENVAGGTQAERALKLTLNTGYKDNDGLNKGNVYTDKQVNVVTREDLEEFLKKFDTPP